MRKWKMGKMNYLEEQLQQLELSGKVEQFEIYNRILEKCYEKRDTNIFHYFNTFLVLLNEYLNFDSKPDIRIRNLISKNFEICFSFIRNSNNMEAFNKYFPTFNKYIELISDALPKAKILQYIGYFFWMKQDFTGSIKYLDQSLEILNKSCSSNEIPARYTNLGFIYESAGEMEKAEYYYKEGLNFAKKHNSESALKMSYDAIGRLNLSRGNYSKAILYLEESLNLHSDDKSLDKVSVINNLATAYSFHGKFTKAKKAFKQIQQKWVKEANPELYYSILVNSATNFRKMNENTIAEELFLKSLEFAKAQKLPGLLGECYICLGPLLFETGRAELALNYYQKAIELAQQTKNEKSMLAIYKNMGLLYKEQCRFAEAIEILTKALNLAKKQKNTSLILKFLQMQSDCFKEMKNFKDAFLTLEKHNKRKDKYYNDQNNSEKELRDNPLIGNMKRKSYVFRNNDSLLSRELIQKIGTQVIGRNQVFLKVIKQTLLASGNSSSGILIRGESGTGKEIIARIIHYSGARSDKPFVAVNSASFTTGIAKSALFGHLKGAFTGASSRQIGHFEASNKGTIFFDEIGDMPLDIQSTLLRVLEEKEIYPIGSHKSIKVDFRMISSTNIDIDEKVKKKEFRLDFLHRINTLEIVVPPLRDRKDDIPILTDYFIDEICNRLEVKRPSISASALKMLCDYDYPGNVRELCNTIEKLVIFCKNHEITSGDIYLLQNGDAKVFSGNQKWGTMNLEKIEKAVIKQALFESNNIKAVAARLLGISSSSMLRRLKKYDI